MRWLIPLCLVFCHLVTAAAAQDRHALVVGIDTYANVNPLMKARNDATAMHTAFEQAGVSSTLVLDPSFSEMVTALSAFTAQLGPGDEAIFFFAGHGVQIDGRNYLLMADIPQVSPGGELVLTSQSLPVDIVLEEIRAQGTRFTMLILDACRDNPFPREGARTVGAERGLAATAPPEGTFIMYSAGDGQTALDRLSNDDPDPNSVFTRSLLDYIVQPGMPVHEMARLVRSDVRDLAATVGHPQFPAIYDQFDGSFSLVPAAAGDTPAPAVTPEVTAPAPAPAPAAVADTRTADPCTMALPLWQAIESSTSAAPLQAFIDTQADCTVLRLLAETRLAEILAAAPAPAPTPDPAPAPAPAVTPAPQTPTVTIDFGDDSGGWPNDGECDDPRFQGDGVHGAPMPGSVLVDASDCRAMVQAGRATLVPGAFATRRDAGALDFGDDSGPWPRDGECDDPRFVGPGAAPIPNPAGERADASDCRRLFEGGFVNVTTIPVTPAPAPAPVTAVVTELPPEARGIGVTEVATYSAAADVRIFGNPRIPPEAQAALETDFAGGNAYFGAFAMSKDGGWGYSVGNHTIEAARIVALIECEEVNDDCIIYAELVPVGYVDVPDGVITLAYEAAANYTDRSTNVLYHAMAISVDGAYAKYWEAASQAEADDLAMSDCEAYRSRDTRLPDMPCFLLPPADK